ncbi:cysteine desulfurase [Candidatus Woesearchaeota archaeon]|nr:cysteine desulfurase [Candidatus Woesearchaeota archaeon]
MNIRDDFPILKDNIIYVDSACMALKPIQVINKINEYYYKYPVCAGRSAHKLSVKLNNEVILARRRVKNFINAKKDKEIIFVRNVTEAMNLIANSFNLNSGDAVMITEKEHNSNLVPWLKLKDRGIKLLILKLNVDGTFNEDNFKELLENENLKLISFHQTSNVDGVTLPIKEIVKLAHKKGIKVAVDAAQSAPHKEIDVRSLDVDFLAISGHKMMGPSGIGVLYGKEEELEKLDSFIVGGETVKETYHDQFDYEEIPEKFEGGLQNYAGIVGLGEACEYLSKLKLKKIQEHEIKLNKILTEELKDFVKIIGPKNPELRGGIFNFYIEGVDMHNFSTMLDSASSIMTRSGQHCVHSYYNGRKLPITTRISLYAYNTEEEIHKIVKEVKNIIKILK